MRISLSLSHQLNHGRDDLDDDVVVQVEVAQRDHQREYHDVPKAHNLSVVRRIDHALEAGAKFFKCVSSSVLFGAALL